MIRTNAILPAALAVAAISLCVRAQSQGDEKDPLVFEVASVKASAGCPPACGLIRPTVGNLGYHIEGAPVRSIMTVAYTVTDRQISGGPEWMNTDRFDIEAKGLRPHNNDQLHVMLQHLLEERFGLKTRRETREESVWNMSVANGGSKMPVHDPDDKDYAPIGVQPARSADGSLCPNMVGHNVTMNYLAFFLSRTMDRAVIDKTGLPAHYDVNLRFLPDGIRLGGDAPPISPDCTDLFSAAPKQLGLKFEAGKGPVEFLVVEKLEKPAAN